MQLKVFLSAVFLTFLVPTVCSQYATRVYEFPQYGFKIPFYTDAKVTTQNKGEANEHIHYLHQVEKNNTILFASLRIFTAIGCFRSDSLYVQSERNVKQHHDNLNFFRILVSGGNTYPLGWSGYKATATVDKEKSNNNNITRWYQAFSNGKVVFDVDIITQNLSIKDTGTEKILEDPGYNSMLLPHNLEKLGIRVFTKGNVASAYDNESGKYIFSRCDKLGGEYPYFELMVTEYEPEVEVEFLQSNLDDMDNVSNFDFQYFNAKTKFSRFSDLAFRATLLIREENSEKKEITSRIIIYYFTFNDQYYRAALVIPFVKDDGIEHWLHANEFTEKTVPLFEERLIEILNTIEKL
jgi:hypothetical protein